jgi:hypothetical protein
MRGPGGVSRSSSSSRNDGVGMWGCVGIRQPVHVFLSVMYSNHPKNFPRYPASPQSPHIPTPIAGL